MNMEYFKTQTTQWLAQMQSRWTAEVFKPIQRKAGGRADPHEDDNGGWPRTRAEAERLGFVNYQTGKPCKWGHGGTRLTSTGGCVECNRLHRAELYYRDMGDPSGNPNLEV
jgi:hypothetical protein